MIPRLPAFCAARVRNDPVPENRPERMQEFLKKRYAAMRGGIWRGLHTRRPNRFRGYWRFEAELVTISGKSTTVAAATCRSAPKTSWIGPDATTWRSFPLEDGP
ncbi:MAG: DUF1911 domain-containing protein [Zoogloeaceae bacterium]|nr:DUF1911 domain-containing protein [Zoogloeaceae bacterium]